MNCPTEVRQLATQLLTPAQLIAWNLETHGHSQRQIALTLGISRSSLIDRLDNAHRTLLRNGVRMDASGNYYLEETA